MGVIVQQERFRLVEGSAMGGRTVNRPPFLPFVDGFRSNFVWNHVFSLSRHTKIPYDREDRRGGFRCPPGSRPPISTTDPVVSGPPRWRRAGTDFGSNPPPQPAEDRLSFHFPSSAHRGHGGAKIRAYGAYSPTRTPFPLCPILCGSSPIERDRCTFGVVLDRPSVLGQNEARHIHLGACSIASPSRAPLDTSETKTAYRGVFEWCTSHTTCRYS